MSLYSELSAGSVKLTIDYSVWMPSALARLNLAN